MCKPAYYDIEYEINPWMDIQDQPDREAALRQWQRLRETYESLGVTVELIEQVRGLPDMVFTANSGIVVGKRFLAANYRYRERKGEEQHFRRWFQEHGFEVIPLSHYQGGEGDALFYRGTLYLGYGFRSDPAAHEEIRTILGCPTVSLRLVNPYYYDFDTTFCPLGDRGVLYFPEAYDADSQERAAAIPGAMRMTQVQAEHFVGNSVYVDGKLLVSYLDDTLRQQLARLDIEPVLFGMGEFKKAGGGIKCLTLYME